MRSTIYNLAIGSTVVLLSSCGGLNEEVQEILGTLEATPEPSATSTPIAKPTPEPDARRPAPHQHLLLHQCQVSHLHLL